MVDYIDLRGQSGTLYRYWFVKPGTMVQAASGNYMFAQQLPNGNFLPAYIGEAGDLQQRFSNHDRWNEARKIGAIFVLAHTTPAGELARKTEEQDLILFWNPALNVQHRKVG